MFRSINMIESKKKNTDFVLMEVGFDYNDEVYFPGEGGNPNRVFTSEKSAKKAAEDKNLLKFKSLISSGDIREYGYSLDEVLDVKTSVDDLNSKSGIFMKAFGKTASDWWKDYNSKLVRTLTDKEWLRLLDCFNFTFYHVVEVEKG